MENNRSFIDMGQQTFLMAMTKQAINTGKLMPISYLIDEKAAICTKLYKLRQTSIDFYRL
jgi:hypothetical protein